MLLILLLFLLSFFSVNGAEQLTSDWLKEQLRNVYPSEETESIFTGKKCLYEDSFLLSEPKIFVAMSFSVPESVWLSLSKELEKAGGIFVLRGLPNNSFNELASKLLSLKSKGVNAPIQLDPKFFQVHHITSVPAFLIKEEREVYKIQGNISLKFALSKMSFSLQKINTN